MEGKSGEKKNGRERKCKEVDEEEEVEKKETGVRGIRVKTKETRARRLLLTA